MWDDVLNVTPSDVVCKNGILLTCMMSMKSLMFRFSVSSALGTLTCIGLVDLGLLLTDDLLVRVTSFPCVFSALPVSLDAMRVFRTCSLFNYLLNFLNRIPNLLGELAFFL